MEVSTYALSSRLLSLCVDMIGPFGGCCWVFGLSASSFVFFPFLPFCSNQAWAVTFPGVETVTKSAPKPNDGPAAIVPGAELVAKFLCCHALVNLFLSSMQLVWMLWWIFIGLGGANA
ncbi:hypothetical protein U1Q18_002493 [Sarracenia purpurea var. burkii]